MAKATLKLVFEAISNIIWLPVNNYARHETKQDTDEERRKIAIEFSKEGWLPTLPIKVTALTHEGKEMAVKYLESVYDALKAMTVPEKLKDDGKETEVGVALQVTAFEKRWMPKGKIVAPQYEAVYGFQRGGCIDLCNAYLLALNKPMMETLPCYVVEYKNQFDRVKDCAEENYAKDFLLNRVTSHWPSVIKLAKAAYEASNRTLGHSGFESIVKENSLAVKVNAIIQLDARFPKLNIVDRIVNGGVVQDGNKTVDKGQEYGSALSRAKLVEFEQQTRPDSKVKANPSDIDAYFLNPKAEGTKATTPAGPKTIANLSAVTETYIGRYILGAIADADKFAARMAALKGLAEKLNPMMEELGFTKDGKPVFPA